VQLVRPESTSYPATHAEHAEPSVLNMFASPLRVAHPTQLVASNPTVGCDPAAHWSHEDPWLLYVPTQLSHAVWSTFGAEPGLQRMHMLPSALYLPAAHVAQSCCSAFGSWPGWHVSQPCMSSAPPVCSLCRWVPFRHSMQ